MTRKFKAGEISGGIPRHLSDERKKYIEQKAKEEREKAEKEKAELKK
jgi:coenzyme F420-reducing hydrogenase alpha subunit